MDNFDLKKFLKESKAIENLNPAIKALNENKMPAKEKMTKEAMKKHIKDMIVAELEGGSSNIEKIRTKYNEMFGKNPQTTFKDVAKALNLPEDEVGMVLQSADYMGGHGMFKEETDTDLMDPIEENDEDYELEDRKTKYGIDPESDDDYSDYFFDINTPEDELEEAKKKKDEEVEDVEIEDTEDVATEEVPAEETPATTGGLEDISADMEGTEGDLMDHLMSAFKIAKGMGNEKLETQVGNTLKFFVSEYIGGSED